LSDISIKSDLDYPLHEHYNRKIRRKDKSGRGQVERDEKA